jgi:hypothetical protein
MLNEMGKFTPSTNSFTLLFSFLLLVLGTGVLQAQSQSDNAITGRAHGALGPCLGQAQQAAPSPIQSRVDVISACYATGFIKRVTFYYIIYGPICNPNINPDCVPPLPLYQEVGYVEFDCDGKIVNVVCTN